MKTPTSTHWGNYKVVTEADSIVAVEPYSADRDVTDLKDNLLAVQDPDARIANPAIRQSYLRDPTKRSGALRGSEPFVEVDWDTALDLAAEALDRTRSQWGNAAIYGGSYGWSSAGRFHHAQSQVHRFLNSVGGYTRSLYSYSAGAGEVIVPRVLGMDFFDIMFQAPTLEDIAEHTRLVVCFGGLALKNTQVMSGGLGGHDAESRLRELAGRDIDFINVSPIQEDLPDFLEGDWWPILPGTDTALMLALAHTLLDESHVDMAFIDKFTVGFHEFKPYLMGESDGIPKDANWAAGVTTIPAADIRGLARRMARDKPMIGISWSIQRHEHGEQAYWMATVLAALLGTHGLPGKGVSYGYGSIHNIGFAGRKLPEFVIPSLPQGERPVNAYIPVARIADVLLDPGKAFPFNGKTITPAEIQLVYWAGGNPFHHHQDLNRLRQAWAKPQTVIVNEPFWTATARRADIVFPVTTPLERDDLGITPYDCHITPMRRALSPYGQARDDYEVFSALAARLGAGDKFTAGHGVKDWLKSLYAQLVVNASEAQVELPEFADFWAGEQISMSEQIPDRVFRLERFRQDPERFPLDTPSGRIEIFSRTIAAYGYEDCLGHPAWFKKSESLASPRARDFPLHLISNQPKGKLHSQYDHGPVSRALKRQGREQARMHPDTAVTRSIDDGTIIRIFNDRGACLAVASLTTGIRPGVVELPTGAWYDPSGLGELEVHGNPNAVTADRGASSLTQATTAHSCLVEVEVYSGPLPDVAVRKPPQLIQS